jgi:hypothetical protein
VPSVQEITTPWEIIAAAEKAELRPTLGRPALGVHLRRIDVIFPSEGQPDLSTVTCPIEAKMTEICPAAVRMPAMRGERRGICAGELT